MDMQVKVLDIRVTPPLLTESLLRIQRLINCGIFSLADIFTIRNLQEENLPEISIHIHQLSEAFIYQQID